ARGVVVDLHEDSIASGCHRRSGECRRQNTVARCRVPCSTWTLYRMCRVKNHAISGLPHPIERTHVGNEVVIAETRAALRETEFLIAKRRQLLRDIAHVPRRKKLTFFYIDRATRFRSCA